MIVKRLLVVVVFVGVLALCLYKVYEGKFAFQAVAATLPEQLAAAKAEGVPLEANDLRPKKPLDPKRNAAPVYREAISKWDALGPAAQERILASAKKVFTNPTSADLAAARSALDEAAGTLAVLDKATSLPSCDFERRYEDAAEVEFPEYAPIKGFAHLTAARAMLAWRRDRSRAVDYFKDADRMAAHLTQEPQMIGMLVCLACHAINLRGIDHAVSSTWNDGRALAAAESLLKSLTPPPDFRKALRGEAVFGRLSTRKYTINQLNKIVGGTDATSAQKLVIVPIGVGERLQKEAYEARLIELWRKVFKEIANEKDPAAIGTKIDALVETEEDSTEREGDRTRLMNVIVMPIFAPAGDAIVILKARRAALLAKIKVLQHRLRTGAYPRTLAAVGPLPEDPFDKKPLRYVVRANGFAVYSIGANRVDDGGVTSTTVGGGGDLVMEHPLPRR